MEDNEKVQTSETADTRALSKAVGLYQDLASYLYQQSRSEHKRIHPWANEFQGSAKEVEENRTAG